MPPPASTSDGHRMNVCAYAFVRSTVVEAAGEPLFWCSSSSPVRRCDAVLSTSMETERARLQAVVFDLPDARHAVRGTAIAITGTLITRLVWKSRIAHPPSLARKFSPIACHTNRTTKIAPILPEPSVSHHTPHHLAQFYSKLLLIGLPSKPDELSSGRRLRSRSRIDAWWRRTRTPA